MILCNNCGTRLSDGNNCKVCGFVPDQRPSFVFETPKADDSESFGIVDVFTSPSQAVPAVAQKLTIPIICLLNLLIIVSPNLSMLLVPEALYAKYTNAASGDKIDNFLIEVFSQLFIFVLFDPMCWGLLKLMGSTIGFWMYLAVGAVSCFPGILAGLVSAGIMFIGSNDADLQNPLSILIWVLASRLLYLIGWTWSLVAWQYGSRAITGFSHLKTFLFSAVILSVFGGIGLALGYSLRPFSDQFPQKAAERIIQAPAHHQTKWRKI